MFENFRLSNRNSDQHRWYYYPQMKKNEVILFKQWDSDTTLKGLFICLFKYILATDCFHIMFVYNSKQADFVSTLLFKIPMHWMIFHPGNPLKQEEYVFFQVRGKIIYTKYSKHWFYTVAHTIECVCSKINNSWFNPWFSFYISSLCLAPYIEWYIC